jgi:hypothetical protein
MRRWIIRAVAVAALTGGVSNLPALEAQPPQAKSARIAVEPESFDFGATLQYKTLTKEFVVRNLGSADLELIEVKTSCGCTAALSEAKVIKPGGQTPLRVTVETRAATGPVTRVVTVRSNDPGRSVLEIKLTFTAAAGR